MSSTTVNSDGNGSVFSSTASTTIQLHPTGPNALGTDTQTHPGDSDYLMVPSDRTVATDQALSSAWVWTLPAASSVSKGWEVVVSDHFGACNLTTSITVNMTGSDTINGSAAYAKQIVSPNGFFRFRSDGATNWQIVGQFPMTGTPIGNANYQMLPTDSYVYTTPAFTSAHNWTLPAANAVNAGWEILVADQAGVLTQTRYILVVRSGSDHINGSTAPPTLQNAYSYVRFRSDGVSNWQIVGFDQADHVTSPQDVSMDAGYVQLLATLSGTLTVSTGRNDNLAVSTTFNPVGALGSAWSISGLVLSYAWGSSANVSSGVHVIIVNESGQTLTLLHQDSNSTAANRIVTPTGASVKVAPNGTVELIYDDLATRWYIQNVYDGAHQDETGWQSDPNTWVYASATSFTISGVDATGWLTKGTKVSWNDATNTPGYGVVASSSFSTNTTVNLITTSDYPIANHAITAPRYSYAANPQGFPTWFNWSPTLVGWTASVPTNVANTWATNGTAITINIRQGVNGTSNATAHTATLPVTAATVTNGAWMGVGDGTDATGSRAYASIVVVSGGTTVALNCIVGGTNTASGGNRLNAAQVTYPF